MSINNVTTCASGINGVNCTIVQLLHIINSCILDNYCPKDWKIAVIRSVPKTAGIKEFKYLPPISILPTMPNLEHVLNNQMKIYI